MIFTYVAHTRYYCSSPDDDLSVQENMVLKSVALAVERSIKHIIKVFFIPVKLLGYLVAAVYIQVN